MENENQEVPEVQEVETTKKEENVPAAPAETAAEVPESAPEKKDDHDEQKVPRKRVDRLTREKYEYKAKADYLEQQLARLQQPQAANSQDDKPQLSQFQNPEDYIEALTDWKLEKTLEQKAETSAVKEQAKTFNQRTEKLLNEAEALGGFDRDDFAENVTITDAMAQAIIDSDVNVKLVRHLNSNPSEASRIANLSPARQAAEIGKLELKLSNAPKPSKAPAPIEPISTNGNSSVSKSIDKMSHEEYRAWRAKQGARWA